MLYNSAIANYVPSFIVGIISLIISIIVAKKFARRFSWLSVIFASLFWGMYIIFLIPIISPILFTYFFDSLEQSNFEHIYQLIASNEFGLMIVGKMSLEDLKIIIRLLVNFIFILYAIGLYILSSSIIKLSGRSIILMWYFLNTFLLILMPLISLIIIFLSPFFVVYGLLVGFYTGIANYILSIKSILKSNKSSI